MYNGNKKIHKLIDIDSVEISLKELGATEHDKFTMSDVVFTQTSDNTMNIIRNRYGSDGLYYHKDIVDNLRNKLAEVIKENIELSNNDVKIKKRNLFTRLFKK